MNGKVVTLLVGGSLVLLQTGCKDRREAARQELRESGYDLTPEDFFRAAESDDVSALDKLVENGMAVDTRDAAGDTALHAAAAAGMKQSADFLLDHQLPVDVAGADERTPLMTAVIKGSPEMVRYLLTQKADPLKKDAHGYRPLMLAVSEGRAGMVAELAAFDREDLDAALLIASLEGKAGVIDELANYGASIYARMDDGRTPLMLAAQNGNIEAVEMLIEIGASRFSMDEQGRIAADVAREAGHEALALRLAEEPSEEDFGIEEPADLGAGMLAGITGDVPEAGDGGALPRNRPVESQGGGAIGSLPGPARSPGMLEGEVVSVGAGESGRPAAPVVMRSYRQKELPLRVETVEGEVASLRISGGAVEKVETGGGIPGSRLKVVRVERRMEEIKDSSEVAEVSVVEVEDTASGRRRELISGVASTAHDPVALVEDAGGRRYLAKAGQKFTGSDGADYVVNDVRPNQMVIENKSTGEVITVPLRGPRG